MLEGILEAVLRVVCMLRDSMQNLANHGRVVYREILCA
jgi:hypothetical protein